MTLKRAQRHILIMLTAVVLSALGSEAYAISFNLDSIAEWGKFPRFCVRTYRWGDQFFNGYDTAYVKPTGYKFNVKITTESWADGYKFVLPNDYDVTMLSDPSTSVGAYLTYLAVSVGYDANMSKLFGGADRSRQRFRFGFNCSLLAIEAYIIKNDVGTTIKRFGPRSDGYHLNVPFSGVDNSTWGVDAYYFFNHKRYSEAAAFSFSRVQQRNQGSFYLGVSIYAQNLDFDFSGLPKDMKDRLPDVWDGYRYKVETNNYALRFGYGYNWVFSPRWVLGVSESPIIGVRKGFVNSDIEKITLSIYNRLKMSVVWNNGRWFAGLLGKLDVAVVSDKETTYAGGVLSGELVVGYRFNLW